ncbi:hypothetical protein [Flavobacterium notoginsengisoli]|uniref:hypothetical protein n=1 Tax=Flavobacterium notoginsengisoli TaxID=1478199 RepID=UPI00364564E5
MKKTLNNKNILFLSMQTFDYEKAIKKKLEELGANVQYFDERPSNNIFFKGIIRIKRNIYQKKINKYYNEIILKTKNKLYHYLFVNRGEVVPEFFLITFKKNHPECECIFYTWDSFENYSHPIKILKYFDKKFTFDPNDAIKFGLNFRPLFYLDVYKKLTPEADEKFIYDLLFIGTAHSDRYIISNKIARWCEENNLSSYFYYFIHGRLVYFYKKQFDKSFKMFDFKKLTFKSLKTEEILKLYKVSNVILDINHPGQKGLTMRTFEAIGARKKIITTNSEIKKYTFYNSNNIYVIDREDVILDKSFFELPYKEVDKELYYKSSIEDWLKCIFLENQSNYWIKGLN